MWAAPRSVSADANETAVNDPNAASQSSLAVGNNHACVVFELVAVKCWGYNGLGQLGDGTTTNRSTPTEVTGITSGVTAISADGPHTCALLDTGAMKCWGYNGSGQLGDGTTTQRNTPTQVSGLTSGVTAISAGREHSCALLTTGAVKCWGRNQEPTL